MLREAFLSSRSFFVFPLCLFCGLADTVWFQTLGEDASPVLDNTRKTVLYDAQQGYYNQSEDPDAIVSPVSASIILAGLSIMLQASVLAGFVRAFI